MKIKSLSKKTVSILLAGTLLFQLNTARVAAAYSEWGLSYNSSTPSSEHVTKWEQDVKSTSKEIYGYVYSYSGSATTTITVYNHNTQKYVIDSTYGNSGGNSHCTLKRTERSLTLKAYFNNYSTGLSNPRGKFVY